MYVDISVDGDSGEENGYAPSMCECIAEAQVLRSNPTPVPIYISVGLETETDVAFVNLSMELF